MKFLLMMNSPYEYPIYSWDPAVIEAHGNYWRDLNRDLAEAGELVYVQALSPPAKTAIVRAGRGALPAITDGPFAEAKEFLAGFWLVDVASPGRAYEIAARASAAPGPGMVPLHMPIEVRQVAEA